MEAAYKVPIRIVACLEAVEPRDIPTRILYVLLRGLDLARAANAIARAYFMVFP